MSGQRESITFFFAVTVAPDEGAEIRYYPDGEHYVKAASGRDSLHPFDVMDVIRKELNSEDQPFGSRFIEDSLWHVRSVKIAREEEVHEVDEDDRASPA